MWYKSGSLSLFSGSKVVLGNNTLWADKNNGVSAGGMLLIFTDCSIRIYEIASVVSDTELVLASEYCGCTENGVHYAIPVFGSGDSFDHAAYVAQIAAMLAGYQSQLTQWKQVLTEHGQVTLTDSNGKNVVVKTLPDLTDAVSRMMDKTLNGADIPDKAQFVANLGLSDVVHKSDLANHTHTASQITDFADAVRKVLLATLAAGQGVSLNYDTSNNQLIVSVTGGGNSGSGNGNGYTVISANGAIAGQNYTFSLSGQSGYGLSAFALKEENGTANQSYLFDAFSATSSAFYYQSEAVQFDGSVHPYMGEAYGMSSDGNFYSAVIRADGSKLAVSAFSSKSVIPAMTSNTLPTGYIASASSNSTDPNVTSVAYKAFDKTNSSTTTASAWLSASQPTASFPQWIAIQLPSVTPIAGYSMATRNWKGFSNSPKSWKLQGSNDGTTWTDLHSVTNDTRDIPGQVRFFQLNQPVSFSRYRLYITDTNTGNLQSFTSVGEFELLGAGSILLRDAQGVYYTSVNGTLSPVTTPVSEGDFTQSGFTYSGDIPASELNGKLPISVVTAVSGSTAYTLYTPKKPQIIIGKSAYSTSDWQKLNSATLTSALGGAGKVSVAVSRNMVDWFAFNGSQWVNIGGLTTDSASVLLASGMSSTVFNSVTAEQWALLFNDTAKIPDRIGIAIALDLPSASSDMASVDSLSFNYDAASSWKLQTPAEVEIRWYRDKVTFKTVAAGNYKLAYQQP
ncbi:discoidin domain-containing protein [Dickeya sp. CFBP 2040]|uniref:discoidin domain-containing protein n=1 Tax=Dickeya sp. CFBP 2040 TaxID=2718531 RepID=UPI00144713E4|nr:discoidin domain-containing protein [Dickeya sp. CFBP 2040]NKI73330.1 discoidin domain-containing protein [Dickeya sp. CFBP 2040]